MRFTTRRPASIPLTFLSAVLGRLQLWLRVRQKLDNCLFREVTITNFANSESLTSYVILTATSSLLVTEFGVWKTMKDLAPMRLHLVKGASLLGTGRLSSLTRFS